MRGRQKTLVATLNLPNAELPVKSQTARKRRKTNSPGLQNGESEIHSSPAKPQYMLSSILLNRREVPPQGESR
jgi:hypothetical protein